VQNAHKSLVQFVLGGFFLGSIIGYLTRPSALFMGQLPFGTVITGGVFLTGFDQMLVPLAQKSLSQMVALAVLGTAVGGFAGVMVNRANAK
jgi:hypothetical protein